MPDARDPADDVAFSTLLERWTGDHLGWEKDEGIGLLWKEGGFTELLLELHRRAPRTTRRLAERLAETSGETGGQRAGGRLVLDFVDSLSTADVAERERRWSELDLGPPSSDLDGALRALEPPMPAKYRRRLLEWLDLASAIEARATHDAGADASASSPVGRAVDHAKLGRGVIRAIAGDIATVELESGDVKRIAMRFLQLR